LINGTACVTNVQGVEKNELLRRLHGLKKKQQQEAGENVRNWECGTMNFYKIVYCYSENIVDNGMGGKYNV